MLGILWKISTACVLYVCWRRALGDLVLVLTAAACGQVRFRWVTNSESSCRIRELPVWSLPSPKHTASSLSRNPNRCEVPPVYRPEPPCIRHNGTWPRSAVSNHFVQTFRWIYAGLGLIGVCLLVISGCVQPLPSKVNASGKTLSVCELSRNFSGYAGQMLTVRGIYYGGLRQQCPQVCPTGEPWPSVLDLATSSYSGDESLRVPFVTDQNSWDSLDAATLRAARSAEKVEVWATVRGYLVVRSNSPLGPCDLVANGSAVDRGAHS